MRSNPQKKLSAQIDVEIFIKSCCSVAFKYPSDPTEILIRKSLGHSYLCYTSHFCLRPAVKDQGITWVILISQDLLKNRLIWPHWRKVLLQGLMIFCQHCKYKIVHLLLKGLAKITKIRLFKNSETQKSLNLGKNHAALDVAGFTILHLLKQNNPLT